MRYDSKTMPDAVRRLLPPEEKKRFGVAAMTMEELLLKATVKKETGKGGLQDLIRQYLRLKGIKPYGNASHKKSTAVVGQPDFIFPYCRRFVAFEAKVSGKVTQEQADELVRIRGHEGIAEVVTNLQQVKSILDDLNSQKPGERTEIVIEDT